MAGESETVIGLAYHNKSFENDDARVKQSYGKKNKRNKSETAVSNCSSTEGPVKKEENNTKVNQIKTGDEENQRKVTDDSQTVSDSQEQESPDGGWGWIVAGGGFLCQLVINTLVSCFGILYSEFLLDLGTSAVISSWIFNLMGFMMTFTGIFARSLVEEFGFRKTALTGALLVFVGSSATTFATSAWMLMLFYSIICGIGNGILAPLAYAVVPYYFKKRIGIANAIMSSGVSAGQFVGPVLITTLQGSYGRQGASLILGGILLHCCVGAMVFHPIEWHYTKPTSVTKKSGHGENVLKIAFRILKSTLGNLKLIKNPVALIVALGGTLNVIGYLNFLMLVPFAMQEKGFTVNDAAEGLAVSGITNLVARLFVSIMADFSWFSMKVCYMTGTIMVAAFSVGYCLLNDLTIMTVIMGLWGCGVGAYMGLFNLVMVQYVGRENLMAELGLTCYLSSFWFLSCGPILGAIRDASGSYVVSICCLAGSIFITFILYLFLPAAMRYEQRRKEEKANAKEIR